MTLTEFWLLATKTKHNQGDEPTNTEWGYKIGGTTLFLSFRWTDSNQDWLTNFNFPAAPYRDMPVKFKAHRGFTRKWKSIRDQVRRLIDQVKPSRVIIAGFSQGGAIATMAHEDIWYNYPELRDSLETVAFGGPRVFSWGTPKERFEKLTNAQYGGDLVTGIPPIIFGFKTVGNVVQLLRWLPSWLRLFIWDHSNYYKHFGG